MKARQALNDKQNSKKRTFSSSRNIVGPHRLSNGNLAFLPENRLFPSPLRPRIRSKLSGIHRHDRKQGNANQRYGPLSAQARIRSMRISPALSPTLSRRLFQAAFQATQPGPQAVNPRPPTQTNRAKTAPIHKLKKELISGLAGRAECVYVPRHLRPVYRKYRGEVPEWLNGTVSKTVVRVTVPRVRIPLSPPFFLTCVFEHPEHQVRPRALPVGRPFLGISDERPSPHIIIRRGSFSRPAK